MKTPLIEIARTYDPNIEAQLVALEALLRSPPHESDDNGNKAALDDQLAGTVQGQTAQRQRVSRAREF